MANEDYTVGEANTFIMASGSINSALSELLTLPIGKQYDTTESKRFQDRLQKLVNEAAKHGMQVYLS